MLAVDGEIAASRVRSRSCILRSILWYLCIRCRNSHFFFFFSSRRRHTRYPLVTGSSDVCSSDLSSTASAADQIAFWPDENHPRYIFVCDEETSDPAVQRVDLTLPPALNTTTIVTGLESCDPGRRTPWGTILVGEEAGTLGGLYEILDPVSINAPINVSDRDKGTTSDPAHLVKRKAVGSLSFESLAIKDDGTMIYGDELAPSGGAAGGG